MKNFNKIIILILSINFLFSLYSIFLLSRCDLNSTYDCLLSKEGLFGDFYYQYNTLKYTGVYGMFPSIGIPADVDGGFDGVSFYGKNTRIIYHSPLYYYLAGFLYAFAKFINVNDLLVLHIFSTVILLFTNILFYFLIKKISRYFPKKNGKRFILYSLALFIFLPTPLHVGIAVESDVLFYLSIIASFLIYLHFLENKTVKNAFYLGIVVGLSLLTRLGGIVVLSALFFYMVKLHLEKKYRDRNLVGFSFTIAAVLGSIVFIRNFLLTGSLYGDMGSRGMAAYNLTHLLYKIYTSTRAFFAGIEGGFSFLKPPLILVGVALILLTLIGLLFYFREIRKKIDLDFIVLTHIFTALFLMSYLCNPYIFLKEGTCYGYGIQNRYALPLAPMFSLFSTMALIKLQDKKPYLKYLIYSFIIITCLVFTIDFISALV